MEPVDGFNASLALPPLHASDTAVRHEMGLRLVDALAELADVDHDAVGLGDFGKPEGFLERQVPRWLAELASYDRFPEYPGPDIGPVAAVAAWLDDHRPATWSPGILHGDYHAANVMFSPDGPDVVAIVDWEMCTIGDPLLDLGWLLATWEPARGAGGVRRPAYPRRRPGDARRAGRSATPDAATATSRRIDWYVVLACFKLGIILEGTPRPGTGGTGAPRRSATGCTTPRCDCSTAPSADPD